MPNRRKDALVFAQLVCVFTLAAMPARTEAKPPSRKAVAEAGLCSAGEHVVIHCIDAKGEGAALCASKTPAGAWSVAFRLGRPGAIRQEFRDVPGAFVESEEAEGAHSSTSTLDYKKKGLELGFLVSSNYGAVESVSFGITTAGRTTSLHCARWYGTLTDGGTPPGLVFSRGDG